MSQVRKGQKKSNCQSQTDRNRKTIGRLDAVYNCKVSINADEIYKGGTCNGDAAPIYSAD